MSHALSMVVFSLPVEQRYYIVPNRSAQNNGAERPAWLQSLLKGYSDYLYNDASFVYNSYMEKPWAVLDTSFWVVGHRVDVLTYLFRFFTVCVPAAVRAEVLDPDPRYPHRVYGYQELFSLLEAQGALTTRNPTQRVPQFHAGEAAALALARDEHWLLLLNEQRALTFARQHGIKAVTVPEFIIYLYEAQLLSARSTMAKLDGIAAITGQRVMQAARDAFTALAQHRGER
jgi:predicted nucleic acid-binding protein